jgi:hypothetical protein
MNYGIPGYGYSTPRQVPDRDTLGANAMSGSLTSNRFNPSWKKERSYLDQMLHNRLCAEATDIKGAVGMYYVTSLDVGNPITKEKPIKTILRNFEVPVAGEGMMQGDNYQYTRFMITGMDEFPVFLHRTQFFEHNMINILEAGGTPTSAQSVHNIWDSQKGTTEFFYKGFTKAQIFPKAGDLIKLRFEDSLYEIMDVSDKVSEDQFSQSKYWFKIFLKAFRDNGIDVSANVNNDTKDLGYVDQKFNQHMNAILGVGDDVKVAKDEVLYRPEFIPPVAADRELPGKGITDQRKAQGPDAFGGW